MNAHETAGTQTMTYGERAETHGEAHGSSVHLPSPTAWPIVLAFGFTLLVAGVLTHYGIGILGGVLTIAGCVGWFREVLPHEAHVDIPVEVQEIVVVRSRKVVSRISVDEANRAHLPLQTFPVLSGLKGGLAGGIAMIFPALAYGLIKEHSIWYPINLLGGAGVAEWRNPSDAAIAAFHPTAFAIAVVIHIVSCSLIGLLYGATLPILPRHPILLGGILAPLLWTGLLHSTLHIINPEFASHIQWGWFLISQVVFGIVAGLVVSRSPSVRTAQSLPFALRLGLESPGLTHTDREEPR
ncbi:MAG TPA: hypothetical protein VGD62_09855 [Acidobacteriaceae bacterium]